MKTIRVEISIEHEPDSNLCPECALADMDDPCGHIAQAESEDTRFSLIKVIPDEAATTPIVEKLLVEITRRYRTLNARKTN